MPSCKILLADNNIGDSYLFREVLRQVDRSSQVHVVTDERQALRFLNCLTRSEYPDMILMDYAVPVRGATEMLNRLTNDLRYRHIPKFVWSAAGIPEGMESLLQRRAQGLFSKPQRPSEVKALVRWLLSMC